jgi:hypothetical protein
MHGFTATWLIVSLIISGIGFVLFNYGRKLARPPQLVAGVAMLVYPYFVPSLLPMVIVAAVLLAALWLAIYLGL